MDKRTLLAVVLSVVIIALGFMIQNVFFPQPEPVQVQQQTTSVETESVPAAEEQKENQSQTGTNTNRAVEIQPVDDEISEREINFETEVFKIKFSTRGGVITSAILKEHLDNEKPLEMINAGESGMAAFNLYFGSNNESPVDAVFNYRKVDSYTYEFFRTFTAPGKNGEAVPFVLRKTYSFQPEDYLFELHISIENSVNAYPSLDFNGYSYTLGFGPQIGPEFEKLDGRNEYRRYQTFADGKVIKNKVKEGYQTITDRINWAAISGKYFSVIGIPDATQYAVSFSTLPVEGVVSASQLYFSRPVIKSSRNEDVFLFYLGPKTDKILTSYNNAEKNGFGLQGLKLENVVDGSAILGWLEWILKKVLVFFYSIIPNYGVAIILLTILIKVVLYPITHKTFESTSKMQALNPKITEIKAKYKDNPNGIL